MRVVTLRSRAKTALPLLPPVLLRDGHDNRIYDITGPRLVDDCDIADVLTVHYDRYVDAVCIGDQEFKARLPAAGKPPEIAGVITGFGKTIRENRFITPLEDTKQLIGRSPVDITGTSDLTGDPSGRVGSSGAPSTKLGGEFVGVGEFTAMVCGSEKAGAAGDNVDGRNGVVVRTRLRGQFGSDLHSRVIDPGTDGRFLISAW